MTETGTGSRRVHHSRKDIVGTDLPTDPSDDEADAPTEGRLDPDAPPPAGPGQVHGGLRRAECEVDPRNAYIRLRPGTKGGKGNILDRGWGGGDRAAWTRLDIAKVRRHANLGGNLGILTGKRSGHFTIDVDPKNGGLKTLARLEAEHGPVESWPATNMVRTPSGGFHLNYRYPPDLEVGNDTNGKVFGPGIDVKGDFGYRVAPGSVTPDGVYVQERDLPYQPGSDWVLDRLRDHFGSRAEQRAQPATTPFVQVAKVETPPVCCEEVAKQALSRVVEEMDALARLSDGDRLPIDGQEVGWDYGYWILAARLVEIAQWPYCSVSLAEAERVYCEHAPRRSGSFDPVHKWTKALDDAGAWLGGASHRLDAHVDEDFPVATVQRPADPSVRPTGSEEDSSHIAGGVWRPLDIKALLDPMRPARVWLWDDLIPQGDHAAIIARGGSGKSLLVLGLGVAACLGRGQFVGRTIHFPSGTKWFHVDMENSEEDWAERLADLGVSFEGQDGADALLRGGFIPMSLPPMRGLDTPEGARQLMVNLDYYGVKAGDVVVLDSTQRVTEGPENDNDTVRNLYNLTSVELKRRGVTVIRTDNTGHGQPDRARGASGKRDDVAYTFVLSEIKAGVYKLEDDKRRGRPGGGGPVVFERVSDPDSRRLTFHPLLTPATDLAEIRGAVDQKTRFKAKASLVLQKAITEEEDTRSGSEGLVTQNQMLKRIRQVHHVKFSDADGLLWLGEMVKDGLVEMRGGEAYTTKTGNQAKRPIYYRYLEPFEPYPVTTLSLEDSTGEDDVAKDNR